MAEETFNINSPKQLSHILFEKMGIKPPKKTATGYSTAADVLESLQESAPIVKKILEYRTLEKLRSTYVDALPEQVFQKLTGSTAHSINRSLQQGASLAKIRIYKTSPYGQKLAKKFAQLLNLKRPITALFPPTTLKSNCAYSPTYPKIPP